MGELFRQEDSHHKIRELNKQYHDVIADVYEEDIIAYRIFDERCQRRCDEVVRFFSEQTQGRLFLDVGCGTGNLLKYGNKHFDLAYGVDVSPNMLKVCKRRGLRTVRGDAVELPFKSDTFDAITCFSVMHHLYEPKSYMKEAHRVLKKGGYFFSDWDPNKNFHNFKRLVYAPRACKLRVQKALGIIPDRRIFNVGWLADEKSRGCSKKMIEKAEYHYFKEGLDGKLMVESLRQEGFTDIRIQYHFDSQSFFKNEKLGLYDRIIARLVSMLTMKSANEYTRPHISIMAKKIARL